MRTCVFVFIKIYFYNHQTCDINTGQHQMSWVICFKLISKATQRQKKNKNEILNSFRFLLHFRNCFGKYNNLNYLNLYFLNI